MSAVTIPNHTDSVSILQASFSARVHVTSIYKILPKLRAFKRESDGRWRIPVKAVEEYNDRQVAEGVARLRRIDMVSFSLEEAAAEAGVPVSTIRENLGKLKPFKSFGELYIPRPALYKY